MGTLLSQERKTTRAEWALVDFNELRIYPLNDKTTLGDDGNCDILLWKTNIQEGDIRFSSTGKGILLSRNTSTNIVIAINEEILLKATKLLKIDDRLTIESYRFKLIQRFVSTDKTKNIEIDKKILEKAKCEYHKLLKDKALSISNSRKKI